MAFIIKIKNSKYCKRVLQNINLQIIFNVLVIFVLIALLYANYYEYKQIQKCKKIIIMQAQIINFLKIDTQNIHGDVEILDGIIKIQEEKIRNINKK